MIVSDSDTTDLKFLENFRDSDNNIFTIKNSSIIIQGITYYPFHEAMNIPAHHEKLKNVFAIIEGGSIYVSIPNIFTKIYELKHATMYKNRIASGTGYTTKLISRGFTDMETRVKLKVKTNPYIRYLGFVSWYREDYHLVYNVNVF